MYFSWRFNPFLFHMYDITKFEYEDFTLYSISRKDDKVMQFCEIWQVKQEITDEWCCIYFPPKKDYINNANEYHLFSCKEPDLHLCKNFENSKPKKITKYFMPEDIERITWWDGENKQEVEIKPEWYEEFENRDVEKIEDDIIEEN